MRGLLPDASEGEDDEEAYRVLNGRTDEVAFGRAMALTACLDAMRPDISLLISLCCQSTSKSKDKKSSGSRSAVTAYRQPVGYPLLALKFPCPCE